MEDKLKDLGAALAQAQPQSVKGWRIALGELTLDVEREQIANVLRYLRDDPRCLFSCLIDICGVDYPGRERRFDVVYHLLAPIHGSC